MVFAIVSLAAGVPGCDYCGCVVVSIVVAMWRPMCSYVMSARAPCSLHNCNNAHKHMRASCSQVVIGTQLVYINYRTMVRISSP